MNKQMKITLWINRCILALVTAFVFLLPGMLDVFNLYRPMTVDARTALIAAYYCCTVPIAVALLAVERLLKHILKENVFIRENVRLISRIRWCCLAVSLICMPAAFAYPSLIFLSIIMAFLALMVTVVVHVMAAAVEIREENDLTV